MSQNSPFKMLKLKCAPHFLIYLEEVIKTKQFNLFFNLTFADLSNVMGKLPITQCAEFFKVFTYSDPDCFVDVRSEILPECSIMPLEEYYLIESD